MAEFASVYFKGIQTKTSDLLMEDSELKEAVNVDLSKYGIIQKRAGYVQVGDTLEADKTVRGLMPYYKSDGTSQLVAATDSSDGSDLQVKYRTVQNYSILQTISGESGTNIEGTNFIDYLFVVGYNSTDSTFLDTFSWDGATYSAATNLTNAPNGKYIIAVNGYLCVINGVDHNAERATSRLWWADPPTSLPPALAWDNDNNWWDFKPHDGEEITGAISNFNRGLIFKNTSFHLFDPVGQTSNIISESIGCDSHRSIVNIDKFTIFYNRTGVYATTGAEPVLISEPVIKFIDAIDQDDIGEVCGGQRDNRYYHLFIGDVTVNDIDYVNTELIYDVLQNSWSINELQDVVKLYCNYIQPAITTSTSTSSSSSSSSSSSISTSSVSTSSVSSSSVSHTGTTSTSSSSSTLSSSSSSISSSSISVSSSSSTLITTSVSSSTSTISSSSQSTTSQDTGWKSPTVTGGVKNDWTNPTNAYSSDNNYATFVTAEPGKKEQSFSSFGFGIPGGATIVGIEMKAELKIDTGADAFTFYWYSVSDSSLSIFRQSSEFSAPNEITVTVGGSTDLWNRTPIDTDFSDANFYMYCYNNYFSNGRNFSIDHIQVKVYYDT